MVDSSASPPPAHRPPTASPFGRVSLLQNSLISRDGDHLVKPPSTVGL